MNFINDPKLLVLAPAFGVASTVTDFEYASHNCWAYVAGPPGDTARVGMSDDGEPHGTAGKPIRTVLLHSGIGCLKEPLIPATSCVFPSI